MRISDWSSDVCSSDLWLRQQGYRSSRSRTNRRADRPVGDAPRRAGAPAADYVRTRPRSREDTADLGITSVWTSASAAARRSSMAAAPVWATALRLPSLAKACHSPSRPVMRHGFMTLAPASPKQIGRAHVLTLVNTGHL